ncbi:HAD hydrolase-like protein [Arthrobacter sp. I2-34]|uniref:HAD hydrolase-like protein n=1 Tax=Arthrobacter hankyongi TaxID=2904801 RepID=A0ABS9L3P6_9MICC|nr:HAD hydrolase-like protein [Arthrobacter hankyongi]MCG2621183.1 HAD hydrolase-like protein [Arthrobacter hankyongi]
MSAVDKANATVLGSRGWVLDVDGCLMRTKRAGGAGGEAMPHAADLVAALYEAGHAVVVCTNASEKTPAEYAAHLRAQGIGVRDEDFATAGSAAAEYIAHHYPGARVLAAGAEGLAAPLRRLGVDLAEPGQPGLADVVVVGAADGYSTEVINAASLAVDAGAPLFTTVDVPWFHGGLDKSVCVSAAVANAIGWATGATPQVLGKPSTALAETLLRRLGVPAAEVTVVGDATVEIRLARHMGANSALVLSGATTGEHLRTLEGDARPDLAVADVAELYQLLYPTLPLTQGARP